MVGFLYHQLMTQLRYRNEYIKNIMVFGPNRQGNPRQICFPTRKKPFVQKTFLSLIFGRLTASTNPDYEASSNIAGVKKQIMKAWYWSHGPAFAPCIRKDLKVSKIYMPVCWE